VSYGEQLRLRFTKPSVRLDVEGRGRPYSKVVHSRFVRLLQSARFINASLDYKNKTSNFSFFFFFFLLLLSSSLLWSSIELHMSTLSPVSHKGHRIRLLGKSSAQSLAQNTLTKLYKYTKKRHGYA
jgi:curved DNA-binding protein CbpA